MRYFFVGIGGVSMSALAKMLWHQGMQVMGSDAVASTNTQELQQMGMTVYIGHSAQNIQGQKIQRVVINGAITDDNPELLQARKDGIKIIYRENLLAMLARRYQRVIAVAGCHGKSTTTAMVGKIFQVAGLEPTIHNGAQDNLFLGSQKWFITEACEFRKSFLKLRPRIAIVTNVDADHLDCYRNLDEIKNCFRKFATGAQILIKNATDCNSKDLFGKKMTITFGITCGDVHAKNLRLQDNGGYAFDVVVNSQIFGSFFQLPTIKLNVPGLHNVIDALAAITCALVEHLDLSSIQKALADFQGVARRFQQFMQLGNTPVILDYAHHPNEIKTTIQTAAMLYPRYLLVFQPHTYTRTLALWPEFLAVLSQVPHLVVYKTYAARGKVIVGGRALDLSRKLNVPYFATTAALKKYLQINAAKYDAIILCGAGDVVSGDFLIDKSITSC